MTSDDAGADPVSRSMGARLEDLVPGVLVAGVEGSSAVRVVAVKWFGGNFIQLTYERLRAVPARRCSAATRRPVSP